jgi:xanthine dehydrogenase accessory factor
MHAHCGARRQPARDQRDQHQERGYRHEAGRIRRADIVEQCPQRFHETERDRAATTESTRQLPHGTARLVPLGETHDLLIEPVTGRPRLVICGGGHVAQAIARQALLLDFDVTVLEDRPEFADPSRFGGAARVLGGHIPDTLATIDHGWSSFIVVATRGHKLDADCVLAAVNTRARYIGLLGSRRKTVLIEKMLREEGVDDARIRAIHAPVGLDLGGRTPAEIALSVLAEITRDRYQATGQSLRLRNV